MQSLRTLKVSLHKIIYNRKEAQCICHGVYILHMQPLREYLTKLHLFFACSDLLNCQDCHAINPIKYILPQGEYCFTCIIPCQRIRLIVSLAAYGFWLWHFHFKLISISHPFIANPYFRQAQNNSYSIQIFDTLPWCTNDFAHMQQTLLCVCVCERLTRSKYELNWLKTLYSSSALAHTTPPHHHSPTPLPPS